MKKRLWLSLAMLVVGAALLATAQLAGATSQRRGGIFKVGTTGASPSPCSSSTVTSPDVYTSERGMIRVGRFLSQTQTSSIWMWKNG